MRSRAPDVQVALTLLGNLSEDARPFRIVLNKVDLRVADLRDLHLEGADFRNAHFGNADLEKAHQPARLTAARQRLAVAANR